MKPKDPVWNMFTICEMNGKNVAQLVLRVIDCIITAKSVSQPKLHRNGHMKKRHWLHVCIQDEYMLMFIKVYDLHEK